jgi:hypothetical protein
VGCWPWPPTFPPPPHPSSHSVNSPAHLVLGVHCMKRARPFRHRPLSGTRVSPLHGSILYHSKRLLQGRQAQVGTWTAWSGAVHPHTGLLPVATWRGWFPFLVSALRITRAHADRCLDLDGYRLAMMSSLTPAIDTLISPLSVRGKPNAVIRNRKPGALGILTILLVSLHPVIVYLDYKRKTLDRLPILS